MDIAIDRDPLLRALTQVAGSVATKSTVPVVANLLMSAGGDTLRLTATDLDIEVETTVKARVTRDGTTTLPARELFDIAKRAVSGAEIVIRLDDAGDRRAQVLCGRARYALPTLPAGDFPVIDKPRNGTTFSLLRSELARLIDKVDYACSTDQTQYALNGAYLHTVREDGSDFLRLAATNRFRLAMAEIPAPEAAMLIEGVIIPRKAMSLMRKIVDEPGDRVEVTITESRIALTSGETHMTSNVIEGSFPDVYRIIRREKAEVTAKIKGGDLVRGIDSALIVAKEKVQGLKFTFSGDGLALSARNDQGGQADTVVDATVTGDDDFTIGFNAAYMRDVAAEIGEADMVLHMWDAVTPIRIEDATDAGVTFVVSTIRTST